MNAAFNGKEKQPLGLHTDELSNPGIELPKGSSKNGVEGPSHGPEGLHEDGSKGPPLLQPKLELTALEKWRNSQK